MTRAIQRPFSEDETDFSDEDARLGDLLVAEGQITADQLARLRSDQARGTASLTDMLCARGFLDENTLLHALADVHHTRIVDLEEDPPELPLPSGLSPQFWIRTCAVPWRQSGTVTYVATARPGTFATLSAMFPQGLSTVRPVIASADSIRRHLSRQHRADLTAAAASRVNLSESCRSWGPVGQRRLIAVALLIGCMLALTLAFPRAVFATLVIWAAFTLIVASLLKIAAFIAHVAGKLPDQLPPSKTTLPLPKVSVLVPLFRETEIANHLIQRLSRLTYPKELLDVVLALEENDRLTCETLASIDLPPWMRVVKVPEGQPKTKPRAMNYALDFCEGEIIGIWDAEDAPEPDQITRVAERFQSAPPDLVCLQGILDYYNARQNWLARCFTVEYATWFRVMLPGMSRLGFAIPLGGTTLFFRRDVLEKLGGWDAHNVTEDADLGFRLARHGYRTEMIQTVTGEEANCHLLPWIRQRSRWLKGYMVTYLVHMRAPAVLYRQLGGWKFWGFQAHFISALSQFMLAPLLWSFWLVVLGLPHPLDGMLSREALLSFGYLFLTVEVINLAVNISAVWPKSHRHLLLWVPSLHVYYPLGALAAYKALYELVVSPFYWDKTQHGLSLNGAHANQPSVADPVSGIQLETCHESL